MAFETALDKADRLLKIAQDTPAGKVSTEAWDKWKAAEDNKASKKEQDKLHEEWSIAYRARKQTPEYEAYIKFRDDPQTQHEFKVVNAQDEMEEKRRAPKDTSSRGQESRGETNAAKQARQAKERDYAKPEVEAEQAPDVQPTTPPVTKSQGPSPTPSQSITFKPSEGAPSAGGRPFGTVIPVTPAPTPAPPPVATPPSPTPPSGPSQAFNPGSPAGDSSRIDDLEVGQQAGGEAVDRPSPLGFGDSIGDFGLDYDYYFVGTKKVTPPAKTTNFLKCPHNGDAATWVAAMPETQDTDSTVFDVRKNRIYIIGAIV